MEGLIICKNCENETPKCNRTCTTCNYDIGERCWRCDYLGKVNSKFCFRCNVKLHPTSIPLKNSIQPIPSFTKHQISSTLLINKSIIPTPIDNNGTGTTPLLKSSKTTNNISGISGSSISGNGSFKKSNDGTFIIGVGGGGIPTNLETRSISPIKNIINNINNRTKDIEKLNTLPVNLIKRSPNSLSWSNLNSLKSTVASTSNPNLNSLKESSSMSSISSLSSIKTDHNINYNETKQSSHLHHPHQQPISLDNKDVNNITTASSTTTTTQPQSYHYNNDYQDQDEESCDNSQDRIESTSSSLESEEYDLEEDDYYYHLNLTQAKSDSLSTSSSSTTVASISKDSTSGVTSSNGSSIESECILSSSAFKKPKLLYSSSKKKISIPPAPSTNTTTTTTTTAASNNSKLTESQMDLLCSSFTSTTTTSTYDSSTSLNNLAFIEKLNSNSNILSSSIDNNGVCGGINSLNNSLSNLNFNFKLNLNSVTSNEEKRLSSSSLLDEIIDAFPSPPSKNPYILNSSGGGGSISNSNSNSFNSNNGGGSNSKKHQPVISLPIPIINSNASNQLVSSSSFMSVNLNSNNINFQRPTNGTISIKSDHRTNLIKEIISTEFDYINDLETIINVFCKPLREFIPNEESANIFSNIEQICQVSKQLYDKLISNTLTIGQVFSTMADSLPVYSVYCNYHQKSLDSLNVLLKTPQFEPFFEQLTSKNELRGMGPHSFLIKPVQRICKYPLLLKELLKATAEDHFDYPQLILAVEKIEKIVGIINSQKKEMETWQRTMQLIQTLKGADNLQLLAANRHLISEGQLHMVIGFSESNADKKNASLKFKKGVYFLFNDIFLFTKQKGTNYKLIFYTFLESILIHTNVSNFLPADKNLFSLVEIGVGGRKWTFINNSNTSSGNSGNGSGNGGGNSNSNNSSNNIVNSIQKLIEKTWEDKFNTQNSPACHRLSVPSSSSGSTSPLSSSITYLNNNGASVNSSNYHSNHYNNNGTGSTNHSNSNSISNSPNVISSKQSKKRNRRLIKSLNIKT